jgi:predicted TIM-barrel fold metal-dependent hydrolase
MTLREKSLLGEIPTDLRIFDAHAHITMGKCTNLALYTLPLEKSIEYSRKIGIQAHAVSHTAAFGRNPAEPNDSLVKICEENKNTLFFYLVFDPNYGEESFEQLEKYKNHTNFIGVKIHPRDGKADLGSDDFASLFDYTNKESILTLCHTWDTEPMNRPIQFLPYLKQYPKLKILIGHMGGTYRGCIDSMVLSYKYENVYCDINGSLYSQIWIEELVKRSPVEKFIFSTDQVFNDPRVIVGRVLLSELKDREKELILCENFENIMGKKLV